MTNEIVYIGIGSNLDEPLKQVQAAITALHELADSDFHISSLYISSPLAEMSQPDYVNAVAAFSTSLSAEALLDALQHIEQQQGRERDGQKWQARPLDLDLLLYGQHAIESARLTVPHPHISQRDFVLQPLMELAPDLLVPGQGIVAKLVSRLDQNHIKNIIKQ